MYVKTVTVLDAQRRIEYIADVTTAIAAAFSKDKAPLKTYITDIASNGGITSDR